MQNSRTATSWDFDRRRDDGERVGRDCAAGRLRHPFFQRDPDVVARELLGCGLARRVNGVWMGGWIVETEAYLAENDAACHSARGKRMGNASIFAGAGTLYVYPIHAKFCMNFVTQDIDVGSAVLVRAIQPVWGVDRMQENRGTDDSRRITSGPGMICTALDVDRRCDGIDVLRAKDWAVFPGHAVSDGVIATPRIGIRQAADLPLRFFVNANRYVSGLARLHTRPRREELPALRSANEATASFEDSAFVRHSAPRNNPLS